MEAIVFFVPPQIGHIVAMAELAKLIQHDILHHHYNRRVSITIMYGTDPSEPPSTNVALSKIIASNPSITFLHLPERPLDPSPTRSHHTTTFKSIRLSTPDVADALRRLSDGGTKIRALVLDLFCSSAHPVAAEQGIPVYYFLPSGAEGLAGLLYMPALERRLGGPVYKDSPDLLIDIPGIPTLPAHELPQAFLDPNDAVRQQMLILCRSLLKSNGVTVNTFDEFEPVAMAAISSGACVPDGPTPPVYYIGPLTEASKDGDYSHETLSWLDSQPSGSVVFMCFGSRGRFTIEQNKAIAEGLERSGKRFIWVVTNPPGDNSKEIDFGKLLPDGFLERTKGISLVVKGWAPQVAILSHESVGGFVTHCGWNSVLEAIVAGKPMVAWPLYANHHMSRASLVKTMGMAIPVEQRKGDRFVTGKELARRLIELMAPEMRGKMEAVRVKAIDARKQGGSSMAAIEKLVNKFMEG